MDVPRRVIGATAVCLAALIAASLARPDTPLAQGCYLAATSGGAVLAIAGMRRRMRTAWMWVTAGVVSSMIAEWAFWVYETVLDRGEPEVSIADPFWILSYVLVGIGIAALFRMRDSVTRHRDVDMLIDVATAGVIGLLVVWSPVLDPTLSDTSTDLLVRLTWCVYPVLDVVLLALLTSGILAARRIGTATALLGGGLVTWLVADLGFAIAGQASSAPWMDVGWMLAMPLLGLAVVVGNRISATRVRHVEHRGSARARLVLALAPLLIPTAYELWGYRRGTHPDRWPMAIAAVLLVLLALLRCVRMLATKDEAVAELDASERYFRALATNAADAGVLIDADTVILRESPGLLQMSGLTGPLAGRTLGDLGVFRHPASVQDLVAMARLAPGELVEADIAMLPTSGHERWCAARLVDLTAQPGVGGLVLNLHDVTRQKLAEAELRSRAFEDELTGLANRALFRDRVTHALATRSRTHHDVAVLLIDLDGFKYVNDTLGHEAGDELLRVLAARMLTAVEPGDTVARLGGDEFAILVEGVADVRAQAESIAERLLVRVRQPVELEGRQLQLACSIGLDCSDEHSDVSSLLRHADLAMYDAKSRGKGRWAPYEASMGAAARERMTLEGGLHDALLADQFELVYQPIYDIASGGIAGFEALLRWRHPTFGMVAPDRFIPILEGNGHIVEVGAWVLQEACATVAGWDDDLSDPGMAPSISVNVSSVQLAEPGFVSLVAGVLERTGLAPHRLVLEITETALMHDPDAAALRLHALRELGARLAIDDFGTGYSSLTYLLRFPADVLKIDGSFIQAMQVGGPLPPLVKGVLDLARTMHIETVAEGIEERHQLAALRAEGCDKAQGYLLSRPLSPGDARTLVAASAPTGGRRILRAADAHLRR